MDIVISNLKSSESVSNRLRQDGWQLAPMKDDRILARHPEIPDQPTARLRLQKLGLLTSRSLRIEFPISADVARN